MIKKAEELLKELVELRNETVSHEQEELAEMRRNKISGNCYGAGHSNGIIFFCQEHLTDFIKDWTEKLLEDAK